jgi:hypothetical protein
MASISGLLKRQVRLLAILSVKRSQTLAFFWASRCKAETAVSGHAMNALPIWTPAAARAKAATMRIPLILISHSGDPDHDVHSA